VPKLSPNRAPRHAVFAQNNFVLDVVPQNRYLVYKVVHCIIAVEQGAHNALQRRPRVIQRCHKMPVMPCLNVNHRRLKPSLQHDRPNPLGNGAARLEVYSREVCLDISVPARLRVTSSHTSGLSRFWTTSRLVNTLLLALLACTSLAFSQLSAVACQLVLRECGLALRPVGNTPRARWRRKCRGPLPLPIDAWFAIGERPSPRAWRLPARFRKSA
jgi:hypothetical protein